MIKQNSFVPYPEAMLPKGFKYPQSYLKLAQSTHAINYDEQYSFPWWFENAESNISEVIDIYFEITAFQTYYLLLETKSGLPVLIFQINQVILKL